MRWFVPIHKIDPRPITTRPRENDRQLFDAAGTEYRPGDGGRARFDRE